MSGTNRPTGEEERDKNSFLDLGWSADPQVAYIGTYAYPLTPARVACMLPGAAPKGLGRT